MIITSALGWLGSAAYLAAHGLLAQGLLTRRDFAYWALNLTGALGLSIAAVATGTLYAMCVNISWLLITLFPQRRALLAIAITVGLACASGLFLSNGPLEILAWIGLPIYVGGYGLFVGRLCSSKLYYLCGFLGGCLMMPDLYSSDNLPGFFINAIWALLSAYGLARLLMADTRSA